MEFTVKNYDLRAELNLTQGVVERKTTIPILSHLLCEAKGNRLTINQNAHIDGENYIVVNYTAFSTLRRVWILWEAKDEFFTPRKANLNLRTIIAAIAESNSETIYDVDKDRSSSARSSRLPMAKAAIRAHLKRQRA